MTSWVFLAIKSHFNRVITHLHVQIIKVVSHKFKAYGKMFLLLCYLIRGY